jgi:2-phosphosulfolactate phosphatase
VFVGCLRNAGAVARAAETELPIGVVAAGERWPDGELRWALEDWLGAGAIANELASLGGLDPDAEASSVAVEGLGSDLARVVRSTTSARELRAAGYAADVDLAVERDVSDAVPRLVDGRVERSGERRGERADGPPRRPIAQ